jgi:membrane fusion protein, copper/silver efflux system
MKNNVRTGALALLALLPVWGCSKKADDHAGHGAPAAADEKKVLYQCPMHPQIVQDRPGDCPICNMRLVPVEAPAPAGGAGAPGPAATHVPVAITPERQQLIGVRTAVVEKRPLVRLIRASARVAYDPDLYNAISDYREAARAVKRGGNEGLLNAARLRLRQMGLAPAQIDKMGGDGAPANLLTPQTGVVWVYAQVYDEEAPLVKPGQTMEVSSPAFPGRRFKGTVRSVDAVMDPQTRTLKVRAEAADPEGVLRPEMYVDAAIRVELGNRLSLPEEALMDSGTRQWVFVKSGEGRFEPRDVVLGREAEGYYEVVKGVEEGETVVASANFLVDSESRLKAAVAGMSEHKH